MFFAGTLDTVIQRCRAQNIPDVPPGPPLPDVSAERCETSLPLLFLYAQFSDDKQAIISQDRLRTNARREGKY